MVTASEGMGVNLLLEAPFEPRGVVSYPLKSFVSYNIKRRKKERGRFSHPHDRIKKVK